MNKNLGTMSVLIIFRKHLRPNRFNELLINSIDTGEGDNAIICSGFFQENVFSASFSTGLCCVLKRNKINLTTIGVYNNIWIPQYKLFRNNIASCGNIISAKQSRNNKWHAKIFILKRGNDPIFGIIGSSNMTSRAFGIWRDFNFEADVVLWDNNLARINSLMQQQADSNNENLDDIIYADYNLERNGNKTAMDRLRDLEKELDIENLKDLPD